jgi:hypothetical protein
VWFRFEIGEPPSMNDVSQQIFKVVNAQAAPSHIHGSGGVAIGCAKWNARAAAQWWFRRKGR